MGGRSEWTNFVKSIYDKNKSKKGYSLGDAMKEASRLRKSGKMNKSSNKKTRRRGRSGKRRSH
jgi:hypothetical protein